MMKLISLSEKILKFLVLTYKSTSNTCIDFDIVKNQFPHENEDFLIQAVALLKNDGFVHIFEADNTIYDITILPEAIRNVEEDTFIKKGYSIIKEIVSLIP